MIKKISWILSLLICATLVLGACTPAAPATNAPAAAPTSAASTGQVTISYAIWDNNQLPAHQQIIAAFEARNPNIKVSVEVVPWEAYWNKLQTAVAGGEAYDTFWMNGPNFPVYAAKGVLMDLQDRVAKDNLDMSKYSQSLVKLYSYKDHVYGLPKDFDTIGLYYNKDLFDKAGVAYPTADWTWDDLAKAAKQLSDPAKGVWGLAVPGDQTGYWNFVYQNGGEILAADGNSVKVDQPAACEAITFLYNTMKAGSMPDAATTTSMDPETQLFPGGKIAMITSGSWSARTFKAAGFKLGVAPLPKKVKQASIIHGLANVVWSGSKHPEEAWAFVKFLGGEEAANILAESGTVIPAYQGMQDKWLKSMPDLDLKVFIDALAYSVPYPNTPKGTEWNDKMFAVMGDIWLGNTPIDQGCKAMASAANTVLSQP
jgi:multiple sugar transport system substrate-binding protein